MSDIAAQRLVPIHVEGLCVTAHNRLLLAELNCRIGAEGITVIMGPNGAGKSLFLRCLHGLIPPQSGRIEFAGCQLDQSIIKRQSFIFQAPTVLRRTVYENLAFVARLRSEISANETDRLLTEMRLDHLTKQPARLLSGGEKQRLAMARALLTAPNLLLMDEATANLDPASVQIIESSLRTAAANGLKIIIVTHDIGQAKRLAHDVLFLNAGQLSEHTPAELFFTNPQSAAASAYMRGELSTIG